MSHIVQLRRIAMSFPEVSEEPHFDKTSFRVRKMIFATWDEKAGILCIELSVADQDVYSTIDRSAIYPVPNKWGSQGWTYVKPERFDENLLEELLTAAYCAVTPRQLADLIKT